MAADTQSTFRFSPRPEAHAMDWEDLMPPVRRAVRDLLKRIQGATEKGPNDDKSAASCFLIHGDRGTGKTTVLLSAKKACDKNERDNFFREKGPGYLGEDDDRERPMRGEAKRSADALGAVRWLPVLDLEPLPPRTNLLTMVLTRVRNALCPSDSKASTSEGTSIYEERADSAHHKLSDLIKDATLMWEDIHEQDTRSRANRQVDAADTYARFKKNFDEAMNTLSLELSRGRRETHTPIVLPIDNIDRSTDHLYSIVKLAQMVLCPHLWLVMAGDRQDVDTFLERAYWKELIRIGEEGAGGTGKAGFGGEDEALVMARRQAAATSHRLLPPSNRIKVRLVKARHTLQFRPSCASRSFNMNKNIQELLAEVPLIKNESEVSHELCLLDLFDRHRFIGEISKTAENEGQQKDFLSEAALVGLRLPARAVVELWQHASWVTTDPLIRRYRRAEKIARAVLRYVIAESSLSSESGRLLQDQIIRRNTWGGTMLDLNSPHSRPLLDVRRLTSSRFQTQSSQSRRVLLEHKKEAGHEGEAKASLEVRENKAISLRLNHYEHMDSDQRYEERLPDLVAAWITILWDVIELGAEDSGVIAGRNMKIKRSAWVLVNMDVVADHGEKPLRLKQLLKPDQTLLPQLFWPMPDWETFIQHDVCGCLWRDFLVFLQCKKLLHEADREEVLPRLLATGWMACALETFLAFQSATKREKPEVFLCKIIEIIRNYEPGKMAAAIEEAEEEVMKTGASVYENIIAGAFPAEERSLPIKNWLETLLPLMLSDLYVPTQCNGGTGTRAETRAQNITSLFKDTRLIRFWKTNWDAILADLEYELNSLFTPLKISEHGFFADMYELRKGFASKKNGG